jgi:hypothetical protein
MSNYAVKDGNNWYQMNPPDAREAQPIAVTATLPEVYLISRCIPNPRTPFWYLMEKETEWLLSTTVLQTKHEVREYVSSIGVVKWMRCEPPYAIPPTLIASDDVEEWAKEFGEQYNTSINVGHQDLVRDYIKWHAAKSKEGV